MGFGFGLVECGADGLVQHKVVAIAEVDGLPFGIVRLTGQQAEAEAAEHGDDGAEVLGGDGAGAAVKVVGMVVLPLGVDDGDAAGLAHGTSAGKGEGHDGETGERLVVGVVDFDGVHGFREFREFRSLGV